MENEQNVEVQPSENSLQAITRKVYSKWEEAKIHLGFLFDLLVSITGAVYFFGLVAIHGSLFNVEGIWRWIIAFFVVFGYLLAFRSLFKRL